MSAKEGTSQYREQISKDPKRTTEKVKQTECFHILYIAYILK